jgi:hypothetical protein
MKNLSQFALGLALLFAPALLVGCGEENKPAETAPANPAPAPGGPADAPKDAGTAPAPK